MLLPRIGCTYQRACPRYHRILVTSTALIKRTMRHSSSCLGIGRHLKLLCACANLLVSSPDYPCIPRHATLRESGNETNGFPPGNEAEDRQSERFSPSGVNFCGCLRHKRLKRVEFIRVIRWQRLPGVVCLQGQKKYPQKSWLETKNISERSKAGVMT